VLLDLPPGNCNVVRKRAAIGWGFGLGIFIHGWCMLVVALPWLIPERYGLDGPVCP